jgi:hypothetical protein
VYILGEKVPAEAWYVSEVVPTSLCLLLNAAMMVLCTCVECEAMVVALCAHVECEVAVTLCARVEHVVTMVVL